MAKEGGGPIGCKPQNTQIGEGSPKGFQRRREGYRARNCRPAQSIQLEHVVNHRNVLVVYVHLRSVLGRNHNSLAYPTRRQTVSGNSVGTRNTAKIELGRVPDGRQQTPCQEKEDGDGGSTKARIGRNGDFGRSLRKGRGDRFFGFLANPEGRRGAEQASEQVSRTCGKR